MPQKALRATKKIAPKTCEAIGSHRKRVVPVPCALNERTATLSQIKTTGKLCAVHSRGTSKNADKKRGHEI